MTRFNVPRQRRTIRQFYAPLESRINPRQVFLPNAVLAPGKPAPATRGNHHGGASITERRTLGRQRLSWLRILAHGSTMGRLSKATSFMSLLDKNTLRILFTVLATAALLAFVWLARKPLLAFLFAMLFAYLLEPLIAQLQKWTRCSRGIAIAVTYAAILAVLLTVGVAVGPRVVEEGRHLSESAPELYNRVASGSIAIQIGKARGWSEQTQVSLQQFIVGHRDQVLAAISAQSTKLTEIAGNALWLVLIPILAIFFLKDKSRFARSI